MSASEARTTGQVLAQEFAAIHGQEAWHGLDAARRAQVVANADLCSCGKQADAARAEALRLAEYAASVHGLPARGGQTALCLSGGGIRSAAFGLGVLQGLARSGLLHQFHYLSTVSGGGYIGAWLTAWTHRAMLRSECDGETPAAAFADIERQVGHRPPFAGAEAAPFRWLRRNQAYLTPRVGLVSPDTWAAVALLFRDLLLNWLVYLPAIMALLLLPRLMEFGLVWWAHAGQNGGSVFGWAVVSAMGWWSRGAAAGPFPGWRGWLDLAGACCVSGGMVVSVTSRIAQAGKGIGDRGFRVAVLLPVLLGAVLLVFFLAPIAASNVRIDEVLLIEWSVGVPTVFVAARLCASLWTRWRRARNAQLRTEPVADVARECGALAVSGLLVGALVWGALVVRQRSGIVAEVGLRDLVAFGPPFLLLAFLVGQVLYAGLTSRTTFGRRDQEWMARASGHYLFAALLWAGICGWVLFGYGLSSHLPALALAAGGAGALTLATALSTFTKATAALAAAQERVSVSVLVRLACLTFLGLGAVLLDHATAALIDAVTALFDRTGAGFSIEDGLRVVGPLRQASSMPLGADLVSDPVIMLPLARKGVLICFVAAAALAAFGLLASLFVDANQFSLHGLYRNRLVRTFLGASNVGGMAEHGESRGRFDGFAESDDIPMQDLRWGGSVGGHGSVSPFPVLNMALNLVRADDLAWQERKAAPFMATPLHVGGDLVGYRGHAEYAGLPRSARFSLGTAMAISGAAASPNWGYHSSPLVGFVMMLFNVRLGWWVPNPGRDPARQRRMDRLWLFFQEALGLTSDSDAHVYLSDGGHFDNLGLYEMVRRRCRIIVVIDATRDGEMTLEDLGRSLRKVSVDLGITMDFDRICMPRRQAPPVPGAYCAVGRIDYPEQDPDGGKVPATLIYVKPAFRDDAPADVRAYAAGNAKFPHDSTANQWFTESQFESYRALGSHVVRRIFRLHEGQVLDVAELPERARSYVRTAVPEPSDVLPLRAKARKRAAG